MKVYQSETGLLIPIQPTSIEQLKQGIESITGIPISAQIILTSNGSQLKDLGNVELIDKDDLYLFNRLSLDPPSMEASLLKMSIDIEPPVPTTISVQSGDVAEYLRAFQSHVVYCKDLLDIAKKHSQTCERLLQGLLDSLEQTVQSKALQVAITNLQKHKNSIFEIFQSFYSHAEREFRKHSSLLINFPTDLSTLGQIPIHASISKDARNLDDYVPKEKLFAWVNRCQTAHVNKTNQLAQTIEEIKNGCEQVKEDNGVDFEKLKKLLVTLTEIVTKFEETLVTIENDVVLVKSHTEGNQEVKVENLCKLHTEQYLVEITKYDRYVRETVLYFSDSKQHLTQFLQVKLHMVAHFQSLIASIAPNIATLSKALNVQSEALLQLLHVHRMAPAWGAALVEVVRRKEYVKLFLRKAKEMADILSQFRTLEEKRRDTFKNEIGRYIPSGLIDGLEDPPPYCEVSISHTQDSLPNLGLEDIMSFNQLVSSMKISSTPTDPNTVGSDSISKLQATMIKMTPQVELVSHDFEKLVLRSGFSDRFKVLEEENKRLRSAGAPSRADFNEGTATSSHGKLEETVKIYEARIKSLEQVLQDRYQSSKVDDGQVQQLQHEVESEKTRIYELTKELEKVNEENVKLKAQIRAKDEKIETLESDKKEIENLYQNSLQERDQFASEQAQKDVDSAKQKQLLVEVATHLQFCMSALKSSDESMVHFDSVLIPDSVHPDNLRQMMRKVEDDIISQMALLQNLKATLSESTGASEDVQSIAAELVTLMQRVSELEQTVRDYEADLTEAQAREAVVEADRDSVRIVLDKTTEALEREQQSVNKLTNELENCQRFVQTLQDQLTATTKDLDDAQTQLLDFRNQPKPDIDSNLPALLLTKETLLRRSRDALEDWSIISRLTLEQLSMHFKNWATLQPLTTVTKPFDIFFDDLLMTDPESFPEEMDSFLSSVSFLIKQTYNKVTLSNQLSPSLLTQSIEETIVNLKEENAKKITFQSYINLTRFKSNSFCLFLPTKNPNAWAAFHYDTPNHFLNINSHPDFQAKVKKREWILAIIVEIVSLTAVEGNNPFNLPLAKRPKSPNDVVIVSALRSALTKGGKGGFRETHPEYIISQVLKAIIEKTGIEPKIVQDIQVGNVLMPGAGVTTARMAALYAGFPETTAACAVNRQCSSGLATCGAIAAAIEAGYIDCGIGAGVESMTMYYGPQAMPSDLSEEVLNYGPAADVLIPMGTTSENVAAEFGVSRKEQDDFALRSHNLAFKAQQEGLFNEEIVPIKLKDGTVVDKDDGIRATTAEGLAKLRPAFKKDGTTTAGNASQVSDGAGAVLLMRRSLATKLGLKPLARWLGYVNVGVPPRIMGIGPALAIPAVLEQVGLKQSDIGVFEINEAFASQAVYCVKKLGIDVKKVNPKGGAIAFGHPMGATGARQVATLLPELRRRKERYGLISMCVGIGMGVAAVIENEA